MTPPRICMPARVPLARRHLLAGAGLLLIGSGIVSAWAASGLVEIRMLSDEDGSHVGFDPVGVLLRPGQTIRWICVANYHTTAAYHPANGGRSLRIPRSALPWASDVLSPGDSFDVTLTVEGVYDYFCDPHEQAGMVGRLIVGHPSGPGAMPFDWFKGTAEGRQWQAVPDVAQWVFPPVVEIMRRKRVPARSGAVKTLTEGHTPVCKVSPAVDA